MSTPLITAAALHEYIIQKYKLEYPEETHVSRREDKQTPHSKALTQWY